MFSVPGWNVSAPIATQVEKPKSKDPNKLGKKAQKRKEKQEQEVNAENVGELWGKVVNGKDARAEAVTQNGVEDTGDGVQETRGKKRKRGKSSKDRREDGDSAAKGDKPLAGTEAEKTREEVAETSAPKPTSTDTESKRDKKKRKKEQKDQKSQTTTTTPTIPPPTDLTALLPTPSNLTPLQKSMRQKLAPARFRHLNESLYTKPSADSLSLFKDDPTMFEDYHRGFAQQVEVWPSNPVDGYVQAILARGKVGTKDKKDKKAGKDKAEQDGSGQKIKPLPRSHRPPYTTTIADLGCGTASLSYRLQPHLPSLNLTLHSYDLSRPTGPSAPLVTIADISALPLKDASVDIAIFCLALMGTNWLDFVDEAYRVLRWKGELWVSEIKSRFGRVERRKGAPINSVGSLRKGEKKKPKKKEEEMEGPQDSADEADLAQNVDGQPTPSGTDVSSFIDVLRKRGFILDALPESPASAIDLSNKMFVRMQFVKGATPTRGKNVKATGVGFGGKDEKSDERGRGIKFGMKEKKYDAMGGDDGEEEREKRVLKPCLYKIR